MFQPDKVIFDENKGTLLLAISKDDVDVPDFIEEKAKESGLEAKEELHITIFGFGVGQKITDAIAKAPQKSAQLKSLIDTSMWESLNKSEFYLIEKSYSIKGVDEQRMTIIQMVDVSGLDEFINKAKEILGIHLEPPPTHITLFSKSSLKENMQSGIGISTEDDFKKLKPTPLFKEQGNVRFKKIALPTRPQPDTIIAIFILKRFGKEHFKGVEEADYVFLPRLEEGETEESMRKKGIFLFDTGGGEFDHHNKSFKTSASSLIASYLGVKNNPALSKLLQFAERDDFYGKGIISLDPLDRAFGLSGLIGSLNKKYVSDPEKVIEIILPILDAFLLEEEKRAFEMPKEFEEKMATGKAQVFNIKQRGKHLKCILIQSDNVSMAGYLRSKGGGGFDVVALRLTTGHVNILTRPLQKVDLRSLAVLIRLQEAEAQGKQLEGEPDTLSIAGALKEVPEWFYDPATNSLLNGGPNPQNVKPTSIDHLEFTKILELGISEALWKPNL